MLKKVFSACIGLVISSAQAYDVYDFKQEAIRHIEAENIYPFRDGFLACGISSCAVYDDDFNQKTPSKIPLDANIYYIRLIDNVVVYKTDEETYIMNSAGSIVLHASGSFDVQDERFVAIKNYTASGTVTYDIKSGKKHSDKIMYLGNDYRDSERWVATTNDGKYLYINGEFVSAKSKGCKYFSTFVDGCMGYAFTCTTPKKEITYDYKWNAWNYKFPASVNFRSASIFYAAESKTETGIKMIHIFRKDDFSKTIDRVADGNSFTSFQDSTFSIVSPTKTETYGKDLNLLSTLPFPVTIPDYFGGAPRYAGEYGNCLEHDSIIACYGVDLSIASYSTPRKIIYPKGNLYLLGGKWYEYIESNKFIPVVPTDSGITILNKPEITPPSFFCRKNLIKNRYIMQKGICLSF